MATTVDLLKDEHKCRMMQENMCKNAKRDMTTSDTISSKGGYRRTTQWSHVLLAFVIFTMVSSVAGHLPLSLLAELRKSNAKTESSKVDVPSSSPPDQSSPSSSAAAASTPAGASPDSPHQQRVALVYLPNREGDSISMDKNKFTEFKMPSASVMSPYYLSIASSSSSSSNSPSKNRLNSPRRQQNHPQSTFSSAASNARFRYPGSYTNAGRNLKVSLPSCSTLKSLWRSGKLVLADSIPPEQIHSNFARARTGQPSPFKSTGSLDTAFVYGQIVTPPPPPPPPATSPSDMITDNEIVDGSIANLPPGRFGEFVRDDDPSLSSSSSQDYPLDNIPSDRVNDITTGSTSRPFVKLSSRSDSYSDGETPIDPITSIENAGRFLSPSAPASPSSSSSSASSSSSSSKAGLSSEFINFWHNGPVKF